MSQTLPLAHEMIGRADPPTSAVVPAGESSSGEELDILNDNVLIPTAPARPSGTIQVTLTYAGRSIPIPVEDPWAE